MAIKQKHSHNYINLVGEKFGRLTVIDEMEPYVSPSGKKSAKFKCQCDCGNIVTVTARNLKNGNVKSCGCLKSELSAQRNKLQKRKYNYTIKRLFDIYKGMLNRCYNENSEKYISYGGRGIKVCDEWVKNYETFEEWALSHGYADHLTLDRIDVNGNYEPSNCRWATAKEQANNTRFNHYLEYNGESHTISEWSDITGISQRNIQNRLKLGWPIGDILTKPISKTARKNNVLIECDGVTHCASEWSRITGVKVTTLLQRLKLGWDVKDALYKPVKAFTSQNQ